jgi:hypothetical protein
MINPLTSFVVVVTLLALSTRSLTELFQPFNVFEVEPGPLSKTPEPNLKFSDLPDLINAIELNKDTLGDELKTRFVFLIKENIPEKFTPFKDSIEKIFVDSEGNYIFNINIYDSINFYAYKIKVFISRNNLVKIASAQSTRSPDSVGPSPIEEPNVPVYYRILNTLHLFSPFKTTGTEHKQER